MTLSSRAVKSKKEMRKEQRQNRNKAQREASKRKMLDALSKLELEFASFSNWLAGSGLGSRPYFNELLNELLEERKVEKIIFVGSHPRYRLTKIPDWVVFEHLSTSVLYELLEKVRTSTTNREQAIAEFSKCLGSLISYVLKSRDEFQAQEILRVILLQVHSYLNYPETFMGQPLTKKEPNVESSEWVLWRKIDLREYITTVQVPRVLDTQSVQRKSEENKNSLPCSGRCVCEKVSDGCMNRLSEAKLKNRSLLDVMSNLAIRKKWEQNPVVTIEAIDGAKFHKEWLERLKSGN